MERHLQEIKDLALKYSREELGRMVQMGMLDPQKAMMAGMMRDRISKQDAKPPQTTAVQDVLGLPTLAVGPQNPTPQLRSSPGIGTPPAPPLMMEAAEGGLLNLSAGGVGEYAGGGIVAFAGDAGSLVRSGPTYGGKMWEELEPVKREPRWMSEYVTNLFEPQGRRRDPITGEEISLVNFLERAQKAQGADVTAPTPFGTRPAAATQADVRRVDNTINPPTPAAPRRAPAASGSKAAGVTPPVIGPFDPNAVKIAGQFYEGEAPKELSEYGKERADYLRSQGVDPDLISKMITDVEGRKGKLEKRKGEAKGEALMMAGLGLIGARRGQEFQALGESGAKALGAYKQDVKDLRAAEEKYDERIETLRMADQQAKQTGAEKDIARRDAAKDRFEAAKMEKAKAQNELAKTTAQVSAQVYGAQTQAGTSMYTAQLNADTQRYVANLQAQTSREYTAALKQQQVEASKAKILVDAAGDFIAKNAANPQYLQDPAKLQTDAIAYANSLGAQFGVTPRGASAAPPPKPDEAAYRKQYGLPPTGLR